MVGVNIGEVTVPRGSVEFAVVFNAMGVGDVREVPVPSGEEVVALVPLSGVGVVVMEPTGPEVVVFVPLSGAGVGVGVCMPEREAPVNVGVGVGEAEVLLTGEVDDVAFVPLRGIVGGVEYGIELVGTEVLMFIDIVEFVPLRGADIEGVGVGY